MMVLGSGIGPDSPLVLGSCDPRVCVALAVRHETLVSVVCLTRRLRWTAPDAGVSRARHEGVR